MAQSENVDKLLTWNGGGEDHRALSLRQLQPGTLPARFVKVAYRHHAAGNMPTAVTSSSYLSGDKLSSASDS